MNVSMDDKDYKFINEQGYDESNYNYKKLHRIILIMMSICVVIELAAMVVLIHFSSHIKDFANKYAIDEDESTPEEFYMESRDFDSIIARAVQGKAFSMDDYKEMYGQLKDIAQDSERYIVTVCTGVDNQSWHEGQNIVTSGMIVSKSSDIVIITDLASTITHGMVYVTFFGGKSYKGKVADTDEALGIAAVRVNREDMDQAVYDDIETAEFADESEVASGESIIVMGNPYGKDSYVAFGNITSTSNNINIVDGSCHLLTTDINTTENMNGFIINLDGKVIGIVDNTLKQQSMEGIVSALVIWDADTAIECMVKGIKKAYLGIKGEDITDEVIQIADEDMPYGVYVKDAVPDSPAYNAGILSGDIIVGINNKKVKTMYDIMSVLAKCESNREIIVDVMRRGREEYKSIEYRINISLY